MNFSHYSSTKEETTIVYGPIYDAVFMKIKTKQTQETTELEMSNWSTIFLILKFNECI